MTHGQIHLTWNCLLNYPVCLSLCPNCLKVHVIVFGDELKEIKLYFSTIDRPSIQYWLVHADICKV